MGHKDSSRIKARTPTPEKSSGLPGRTSVDGAPDGGPDRLLRPTPEPSVRDILSGPLGWDRAVRASEISDGQEVLKRFHGVRVHSLVT